MANTKLTLGAKLALVQQELKVQKSQFNKFGNYKYRSAEDILEALKPFNKKYDVHFLITETYHDNGILESNASINCNDTADSIQVSAYVCIDWDQKGMAMPQRFGSASSYGKKYALGNLLLIDDTADPDATNDHGKGMKVNTKNLPPLKSEDLEKVKKYLADGGKAEAIFAKYTLTAGQKKELGI